MITTIIQARMNSTRLYGKVLLTLGEKNILEHVLERVKMSKYIKEVVVATSNNKSDDKIVKFCESKNYKYFRGSLNDVLDRYYQAAKKFNAKHICRITSDCPFIDPEIINQTAEKYLQGGFDYVSTAYPIPTFPDGLDVEIFTFAALKKAWAEAELSSEREHVTPYIWKNAKKFKIFNLKNKIDKSTMRWTVDEKRDLEFVREVYIKLKDKVNFKMKDILSLLKKHPELSKINQGIDRNEGYSNSLKNDFF